MKPNNFRVPLLLALSAAIAACVPQAAPPPPVVAPAPAPTPAPAPAPVIVEPVYENWLDAPQTPGDWRYEPTNLGSVASFGVNESAPVFVMWCDLMRGVVELRRPGAIAGPLTVRVLTETTNRLLNAVPDPTGAPWLVGTLGARDPLLDAMAITKGRFAVETEGKTTLYIPAWAEVTRVIEDCR